MDAALKPGDLLEDRFCVVSLLGTGGTSSVFLADDPTLERKVAVKILHTQLSERSDLFGRFQREAFALTRLQHPAILTVYRFGRLADGTPYLVTEYVEGASLHDILDDRGPYNCTDAALLMMQVAEGLSHAHREGIIHRDLKPANLIIRQTPSGPQAVVLDFGLCKTEGHTRPGELTLTQDGFTLGTPAYMSPEQCLGQNADARSDIYSLGCIFFEMLTGVKAFQGSNAGMILLAHLNQAPPRLHDVDPGAKLPELAQQILDRCLAKPKEQRYQNMTELQQDLQALCELKSVRKMAARHAEMFQERTTSQRKPAPVALAVAGAGTLLLAFAAGLLFFTDSGNLLFLEEIEKHYPPAQAAPLLESGLSTVKSVRGTQSALRVALEAVNGKELSNWPPAERIAMEQNIIKLFAGDAQAQLPLKLSLLEHSLNYLSRADDAYGKQYLKPVSQVIVNLVNEFVHDPTLSKETWTALHDMAGHYRAGRPPGTPGWSALIRVHGEATIKILGDRIDLDQSSEVCRSLIGCAGTHRKSGYPFADDADWEDVLKRCLALADRHNDRKRGGWAHIELAMFYLLHDRIKEGELHIKKAEEYNKLVGLSAAERDSLQVARTLLAKRLAGEVSP